MTHLRFCTFFQAARRIVVGVAMIILCTTQAPAQLHKGEKSFGPRIGFTGRNTSVSAGLSFQVSTATHVRIAPEAAIVFRNNNKDALSVAVNIHFPFSFADGRAAVYPLAGIEYLSWGLHDIDPTTAKDTTTHANRIGGNAGGGIELRCTPSLKVSLEARYTFVQDYSTAQVSAGISYIF